MLIKDLDCLGNILESVEKIELYSKQFKNTDNLFEDPKSFDAIMMNFIIVGEMAAKLYSIQIGFRKIRRSYFYSQQSKKLRCNSLLQSFLMKLWVKRTSIKTEKLFGLSISEEFKINNPEIEWWKIKGFRNIVAHDYFGVDAEEVWQIIQNKIPQLKSYIQKFIK